MILLLSTASNLYWLGRYMIRIDGLCRLLPFTDNDEALHFSHAFSLSAWDAETLNTLLHDPSQPASIYAHLASVRENMQCVRGVISQQMFELLNSLTNSEQKAKSYLCDLISQCCEKALDEEETIRLFWQLGQSIEQIDNALRLKQQVDINLDSAIQDLRAVVESLSPIGWTALELPWVELQHKKDITSLYSFCDQMQSLFEEGP